MNTYFNYDALEFNNEAGERDVSEIVFVEKYKWETALKYYPKLGQVGGMGSIVNATDLDNFDETVNQKTYQDGGSMDGKVEIAWYYNKVLNIKLVFAGSEHTILEVLEGKDYPHIKKSGESILPVTHLHEIPSIEGFYNYGIGHIIYQLAELTQEINNKAIRHGVDNMDPIRMINVPANRKSSFFKKLFSAETSRKDGGYGFVVNEYNQAMPNANRTSIDEFKTDPITTEWERLFNFLDRELKRMGINLDDIGRDKVLTATQVISEEESANAFIQQTMADNSFEIKNMWDMVIDSIPKLVNIRDKTPLDLTTKVKIDGEEISIRSLPDDRQFTLGKLAEILKKRHFFTRIDDRTGTVGSRAMKRAQIMSALQFAQQGTPEFNELANQLYANSDLDINIKPPQQAEPQGQGQGQQAQGPAPSGAFPMGQPANEKI